MFGRDGRKALKLHDRADEYLNQVAAPSALLTEELLAIFDDLGEVTEEAKNVLVFSSLRGYVIRMASREALHFGMPTNDPAECLARLCQLGDVDEWFFGSAFPQGAGVWDPLTSAFYGTTKAILRESDPDCATWPVEVIDQVLRMGYLARCIDEWFDLSPTYREQ